MEYTTPGVMSRDVILTNDFGILLKYGADWEFE